MRDNADLSSVAATPLHPLPPPTQISSAPRRLCCSVCLRPQRTCICQWITPTANLVDVLLLQHPDEVHQAKGSARLLHLSLARCRIEIGETFPEGSLSELLLGDEAADPVRTMLLYPPTPGMARTPDPDPGWLVRPHRLRLVVLDATWRKSLKMLYCNPILQALPRFGLDQTGGSNYLIRKARHPHQLSTLEATCHALAQLEHGTDRYQPLLAGFQGFVAQQQAFRFERGQ